MVSIVFFQQGNDTHTVLHIIELKLEFATKTNNNKKKHNKKKKNDKSNLKRNICRKK